MFVISKVMAMAWRREQSENQYALQVLYDSYAAYVSIAIRSSF